MVVLGALAGCLEANVVLCADGVACPVSYRCDDLHHTCVSPDQFVVCEGAADGVGCATSSISGGCFDHVCLPRGCGNRVVEPGEMCDDGNQLSDDGCSSDCRSTERCGNGFVDRGEPCDDGNLISRDGCDSRCQIEDATWSVIPIAPGVLDARRSAYDAARERLVVASWNGDTWEWDGARWTFLRSSIIPQSLFYDPEHLHVDMVGGDDSGEVQVYAWTDARWRQVSAGHGPVLDDTLSGLNAAYDTVHHQVVVLEASAAETRAWTLDAMGSWSPLPAPPATLADAVVAFDPISGQVMVETSESVEWVHDDTGWTSAATSFGQVISLAFDPDRGHLVLVDRDSRTMYERVGTDWTAIENAEVLCSNDVPFVRSPLYYDGRNATLELFSSDGTAICEWSGSWSSRAPALPFRPVGATYDPVSRRFVIFHNAHPADPAVRTEAWALTDAGWHRIETPSAPSGLTDPRLVYSPGRAATVLYGERPGLAPPDGGLDASGCGSPCDSQANTWSFDGVDWTPVGSLSATAAFGASNPGTYDPENHRVVIAKGDELWSLGDTDQAWLRVDTTPSVADVRGLAWNARSVSFIESRIPDGFFSPMMFELRGKDWTLIDLVPNAFSQVDTILANDQRAGGVIAIDANHGVAWERVGPDWVNLPPFPLSGMSPAWTGYDPIDGRVLVVGVTFSGNFAAILTRTSSTPPESCLAGEDVDGDGLAGCDDPDCYWACSGCLPHTTCL